MNDTLDSFQRALLDDLRAYVVARQAVVSDESPETPRDGVLRFGGRRRRVGALVAAAACAALAAAVGWPGPGATPAYAVTQDRNGDVEVSVNRTEGAAALERALREKGVAADVTYPAWGKTCAPGRYTAAPPRDTDEPWHTDIGTGTSGGAYQFVVSRGMLRPGDTLVLEVSSPPSPDGGGKMRVSLDIAAGPVGACVPVDAPEDLHS